MNLKERIDQILQDFNNDDVSLYEDRLEKATTDILKTFELDEGKILGIIKSVQIPAKPNDDEIYLHSKWIEAVAKAIAQGDVWKEER